MEKPILTSRKNIFQKFVGVDELYFDIPDKNTQIKRFVVTRPNAAAIVLFNTQKQTIVFIRQFRAPVFTKDKDGVILEIPAGVLEKDESAEDCIIRETLEETGYKISSPEFLVEFYPSCGLLNEKISLFLSEVENSDKIQDGGGLDSENEYLDIVEIPVKTAFDMLDKGEFLDAKTMLGIFYLRQKLFS